MVLGVMDDKVANLVDVLRAFGPHVDLYLNNGVMVIRLPQEQIPMEPWPDGFRFEELPENPMPHMDAVLDLAETVELAKEMGVPTYQKADVYRDVTGMEKIYRPARFETGVEVWRKGQHWFILKAAAIRRILERKANKGRPGRRPGWRKGGKGSGDDAESLTEGL